MKKWLEDIRFFWKNKYYCMALYLTAVLSYGYLITHQTVGIDDTPYAYYFEEGLAAIVGRWVMFLVNKVFHVAEFAPFVTDLAGVLIFMAAVTIWCVLMRRIMGEKVPMWGYILFASLFISNSLHSEVFTYYLHNGVATGYLFSGISLCCLWEGWNRWAEIEGGLRQKLCGPGALGSFAFSAICIWIAMGCYESFMIVYLVGVCVILCTARMQGWHMRKESFGGEKEKWNGVFKGADIWVALCIAAVVAVVGFVLRSLMVSGITAVFDLEYLTDDAVQRSITEMMGWMQDPENAGLFGMLMKRIFVMYGVFAYAYYPIAIYVLASVLIGVICLWMSIRRRDLWITVLGIGSFIASYLLVVVEGKATLYRAAQFLPLVSAWGLLLAVYGGRGIAEYLKDKYIKIGKKAATTVETIICLSLVIILWNQCTDMNKWFYVDDMKYENAKNTVDQIAYELEGSFDLSKPVVFTGTYQIPKSIIQDAYVDYKSETYYKMLAITSLIDPHLLEKYYRDYGVWVAQTPALSVIDWGKAAFDTSQELVKFFAMHGHTILPVTDWDIFLEAVDYSHTMPSFPKEGAIVDVGDYIIVKF